MSDDELLTPKRVAKRLGVGVNTVAAIATLAFAIAGGSARADDKIPVLGGIKHQILNDAEMSKVVGGVIASGTYQVSGMYGNGTPYTGTVTITSASNGPKGLYTVSYTRSDQKSFRGIGFENNNVFGVVQLSGVTNQPNLYLYTINPDGTLTGRWVTFGSSAPFATERLLPSTITANIARSFTTFQ